MTERRAGSSEDEYETIRPVVVDIGVAAQQPEHDKEQAAASRMLPLVVIFGLLILLAMVVLVLPSLVGTPVPDNKVAEKSPMPAKAAQSSAEEAPVSPWQAAQLSKAREAAREALNQVLDLQFTLQELQVERWAAAEFSTALETAKTGDEQYRTEQFTAAEASYVEAADRLQTLLDSAADAYETQISSGHAALAAGNAAEAQHAFDIALGIRPDDEAALQGLARAEVLDQVTDITDTALGALKQGDAASAAETFRQALALDSKHTAAREGLARAEALLAEQRYGTAMSDGYSALAAGDYDGARRHFSRAAGLRPGTAEVQEALAQVDAESTLQRIETLLDQGAAAAAAEQWDRAVERYSAALAIDSGLTSAQEALKSAQTRQRLDRILQETLDQPLRLLDDTHYENSLRVYRGARALADPGPRLKTQLRQLDLVLRSARKPVAVNIASDNETEVSLLRVRRLGRFHSVELDLNPGEYVIMGRRPGYRDVRQEFVVLPGTPPDPLDIRCTEPI